MTALKTIRVHGALAKLLKRRTFKAAVRSPQEAVAFLLANFPEAEAYMRPRFFHIRAGGREIYQEDIDSPTGVYEEICITPAICGAGGSGVGSIIGGAFLIAAAIFVPFAAPVLLPLGIGLALTGVAQVLTPVPSDRPESTDSGRRDSYNFSGLQQTSREGIPVPLVYGEIMTGSVVLSVNVGEDEEELELDFDAGAGNPNVPDLEAVADLNTIFNDMDALYPGICWGLQVRDYIQWNPNCVDSSNNNPNYTLSSWGTSSETRLFSRMGQGNYFQSLSDFYVAYYLGDQCWKNEIGSQIRYTWLKNCDGVVVNQQKGWPAHGDYIATKGYINNRWA